MKSTWCPGTDQTPIRAALVNGQVQFPCPVCGWMSGLNPDAAVPAHVQPSPRADRWLVETYKEIMAEYERRISAERSQI